MTNRYRSSCCCSETENQSVCFTGFGAVPKTQYRPDSCRSSLTAPSGMFNRHDNWSFCVHDTEEELVCVIERTAFKSASEIAYGGSVNCDCDCLTENESNAVVGYESKSRPPIVVWYKHPYTTGLNSEVPSDYMNDLYYWRSYWREDGRISPKLARHNTLPCGCPPHKYSGAVGCRSDYFCDNDIFNYCGYDTNDNQLVWWRDISGNIRYLTQSEIQFIGDPNGTGINSGWRTSNWGYVPGGAETGNNCYFGLIEGNTREQKNGDYLYLQDIISQGSPTSTNGKPRLFKNYGIELQGNTINVVLESGWGSCQEYPYGLWPLAFTFWGVMHREKWWQQYWNSISENDVCPSGNCDIGIESDIYQSPFAERCRVPLYIIEQCAGVPIFTHELVNKLNTNSIKDELNLIQFTIRIPTPDGIIQATASSPAAYVMAAMQYQNAIHPSVLSVMEREGILPPPINYGEEQDYRIFKKTFEYHDLEGTSSNQGGRCCINTNSAGFEGPLYCDCAIDGAEACGFTGTQQEAELLGITTCWDLEYFSDLDNNGVADGIECARFVCGDYTGQAYSDFLNDYTDAGFDPADLEECCNGNWGNYCVEAARIATEYGYCGPSTLCLDVSENICRNWLGSQHFDGATCSTSVSDPNIDTCRDKFESGEIGSCCIVQNVTNPDGSPSPSVHCLEISKSLCDAFPTGIANANSSQVSFWINNVWNNFQGNPGVVSVSQLQQLWQSDSSDGFARCTSLNGACTSIFTELRNCEPICDTDNEQIPNRNSFICTNSYTPCTQEEDGYPCTNEEVPFTTGDYYFYGRPGGWRHICQGSVSRLPGEESNEPDPDPNNEDPDYWGWFFPQSGSEYNGADNCPQDGCWSAAPYPTDYTSDPIPTGINVCPQRLQGGLCEIRIVNEGDDNCGEPLLSVCGSGRNSDPVYPGDDNENAIYWPGSDANYQSINPYCYSEAYSHTCFGAWFQHNRTSFLWVGSDNGGCARNTDYYCSNINNAFWLRVPGLSRNDNYCRNYEIQYSTHEGGDNGGGQDDNDWTGELGTPAVLVYHNRVLDDFIQFYGGCVHEITQGDSDADLNRLVNCGSGSLIMQWDIFQGNPSGEYSLYVGDAATDKVWIERNNGDPSSSSNPYKITIHVEDGIGTDPPDLWWGIVLYDPSNIGLPVPISSIITTEGCNISNPTSLWPTTVAQNKIYVKTKDQNPGNYPNGLRDYSWYHAPITRESPLPSAFYITDDNVIEGQPPQNTDCWTGNPCCNTKLTVPYAGTPVICDYYRSDNVQGQPGGESECNYERLPSNGESLPDPMCGTCPSGTYCCPYLTEPRCIPDGTYCCSNCQPGEICVSIDGTLTCIPE